MPLISILLPTFARNASGLLAAAIESVLAQTFSDFELLVVDDGSTDGSADTIAAFAARDSRVRVVRFDRNVGLPALTTARAFCEASGACIAWMFDDCVWDPACLAALVDGLEAAPSAAIAYGRCRLGVDGPLIGAPLDPARLAAGDNHIPNCATLIRREAYEAVGWPDPHILLVRFSDWDFWNRAAQAGYGFAFVDRALATERGVGLPDSLGNTTGVNRDLMMRYSGMERAAALHPSRWPDWRPLAAPPGLLRTDEERAAYLAIALDHLARTGRLEDFRALAHDPELQPLGGLMEDPAKAFAWWGSRWRAEAADANARAAMLQGEVLRRQAYIDEQQAYIDAQLANREREG